MKLLIFLISFVFFLATAHYSTPQSQTAEPKPELAQGEDLLLMGRYNEALSVLLIAKKKFKTEENWKYLATTNNKISEVYLQLFELEKANQLAQETLEVCKTRLTKNHQQANALNNLGNSAYLMGQHEKSFEFCNEAIKVTEEIEKSSGERHLQAAPINIGIGNAYFSKQDYEKALKHYQSALGIYKSNLGNDHPYVGDSYLSIGNLYKKTGSFKLARENYDKALAIYLDKLGASHPSIGSTYLGIGDIYKTVGSYGQANQYYHQANSIFTAFFDQESNPKFGEVWLGQGDIAKNQGDYATALSLYFRALELYKKTVGDVNQNTVRSYLGIANSYIYQEKFREALEFYGKILDINFNLVGDNHENTSATYNNLGSLYYFAGEYNLSERYFRKAIQIDESLHGKKHPNVANAYYNIARIYGEKGETKTALENVQLAINASIKGFDNSNIFVNPILLNFFDNRDLLWYLSFKGQLLEEGFAAAENMKGLDLAIHSFVQSDSLINEIKRSYTDRKDEIALAKLTSQIYQSAVNSCFTALEILNEDNVKQISPDANYQEKKQEYENNFFFFAEKKKGAILFSSLAEANAKSFGNIPDELIYRDNKLKQDLDRFTTEISFTVDAIRLKELQDSLFLTNRLYEELILKMESSYPKYYDIKYDVGVVPLSEFQGFLSDSTAAISYFLSADQLYVALISKKGIDISKVRLEDSYEHNIVALRKSILFNYDQGFREHSRALYKLLFPIEIGANINKLIIIPDGKMATIPFEALLKQDVMPQSKPDWSNYPYLINDFAISYTYSGNLLYKTFKNEKTITNKAKEDLLTLAPVEFKAPYSSILAAAKNKSYNDNGIPFALRKSSRTIAKSLQSIPASELETRNISSIFKENGKSAEMVLYGDATEDRMKLSDLNQFKYVHIASHGFVNQEEPEFSGIIFNADSTREDGILFSGEIYGLGLNCEMVTMSACETGLGKIKEGEGIIGITRALIYAGAKNVNVSLWKVNDQSTSELMTDFYSRFVKLKIPEDKFESIDYAPYLRKAKLQMIHESEYIRPKYWSSFVLIGK